MPRQKNNNFLYNLILLFKGRSKVFIICNMIITFRCRRDILFRINDCNIFRDNRDITNFICLYGGFFPFNHYIPASVGSLKISSQMSFVRDGQRQKQNNQMLSLFSFLFVRDWRDGHVGLISKFTFFSDVEVRLGRSLHFGN